MIQLITHVSCLIRQFDYNKSLNGLKIQLVDSLFTGTTFHPISLINLEGLIESLTDYCYHLVFEPLDIYLHSMFMDQTFATTPSDIQIFASKKVGK